MSDAVTAARKTTQTAPSVVLPEWRRRWQQNMGRIATDVQEIELVQRRIYVLPTLRGLTVIVLIVLLLLIAINYQLSLAYVVAFLLGGIMQTALIISYRNMSGLIVRRGATAFAQTGETLNYSLGFYSPSRAREGIMIKATALERYRGESAPVTTATTSRRKRNTIIAQALVHLSDDEQQSGLLQFESVARGVYRLPRLIIESVAPYGLVRAWSYVRFNAYAVVTPVAERNAPPIPRAISASDEQGSRGNKGTQDPDGLREYVTGDSLRRVAWKQVAKSGKWYTRTSEQEAHSGDLALDWSSDAIRTLPDDETRLARLKSWLDRARSLQARFQLTLPNAQQALSNEDGAYQSAQLALAAFPYQPPFELENMHVR